MMSVSTRTLFEMASTTVVTMAALVMVGFYLHDRSDGGRGQLPRVAENWKRWEFSALRLGPTEVPVVISVYTDFTCPFCRALVPVLDSLREVFPATVAVDVLHFPLEGHPWALPAAVAAECADRQGKFPAMFRALFAGIDSIGLREWSSFGVEAGLSDVTGFEACVQRPAEEFPRIAEGLRYGAEAGVDATPTIWVNGGLFNTRSLAALKKRARELGAGGS